MGRGADIPLLYRNEGRGQPWANQLAEGAILVYVLKLRDRCRSGLSGSPGKRVLGKTNRGFESLPVRTLVRTGCLISRRGKTDGAGVGLRGRNPDRNLSLKNGPIPPCPNTSKDRVSHIPRGRMDGTGSGPRGRIAGARSAQIHQPGGVPAKTSGRQGINPDRKCKFQLRGLGRAGCPQPASFNICTRNGRRGGVGTRRPT